METTWEYIETPYGKEVVCKTCGSDVHWQECYSCDEGYSHHDCGEDTCCCRDPRPNVKCDICNGEGGWWVCLSCKPTVDELITELNEALDERKAIKSKEVRTKSK